MEPPPPGAAAATAAPHTGEPQAHNVEGPIRDPTYSRPRAGDVAWPGLPVFGSTATNRLPLCVHCLLLLPFIVDLNVA